MRISHSKLRDMSKLTPYLLFALALVVLVIRSFYGFCWVDESFYISLADRLHDGAAPFVDEWHPAQVYAPLLLPFYDLWLAIAGGTAGVVLWFRLLYVAFSFVLALAAYLVLKRDFGRFVSCCIALCYLFYVRANILGMSYYSLCTTFFLAGLLCAWRCYTRLRDRLDASGEPGAARVLLPFSAGVFFALSIICNPYVIFIFALACLAGLIFALVKHELALFVPFLWAICGAFVVAAIYLWFVFQRVSPADIVANLGNIMASHDENLRFAERIPNYLGYLPVSGVGFAGFCLLTALVVVWRALKREVTDAVKVTVLALDIVCHLICCYASFTASLHPNKVFIAFVEFAVPLYFLSEDLHPKAHAELFLFWIPGILLSLVWQFSSNTQVCGIIIGYSVAAYGAFITVAGAFPRRPEPQVGEELADEELGHRLIAARHARWVRAAALCSIALITALTAAIRLTSVYSDCAFRDMTTTIETGPAAGLRTSAEHAEQYRGVEQLVAKIDDDGGVWIVPMSPWAYLETRGSCAMVSTWNTFPDEADFEEYFGHQGHAKPEWILVTEDDLGKSVNITAGREHAFPALEPYKEGTAKLRAELAKSGEYAAYMTTEYGTLYKQTQRSVISQG